MSTSRRASVTRAFAITLGVLLLAPLPTRSAHGRPRRPPKPVPWYQFSAERLDRRLSMLGADYERITLLNDVTTRIGKGEALCRMSWEGRRVELYQGDEDSIRIVIPVPLDAELDRLEVYRVSPNGRSGHELELESLRHDIGDSLITLTIPTDDCCHIVDVQYAFEAETYAMEETFGFVLPWPTLQADYCLSMDRDFWYDIVNRLGWTIDEIVRPPMEPPERQESTGQYTWLWRREYVEPDGDGPEALVLRGVLPAPLALNADLDSMDDASRLKWLRNFYEQGEQERMAGRLTFDERRRLDFERALDPSVGIHAEDTEDEDE